MKLESHRSNSDVDYCLRKIFIAEYGNDIIESATFFYLNRSLNNKVKINITVGVIFR